MSKRKNLLTEVYRCEACGEDLGFRRPELGAPLFKFPPTIGATGRAPLLFVGINPRISPDNENLHERIIANRREFSRLARNWNESERYIEPGCEERHYHPHVRVVQSMFGEQARFEDYAAVTELFFCATRNSAGLNISESPCAARYFERVFLKVRPVVVFCVWKSVLRYFQRVTGVGDRTGFILTLGGHSAVVVQMPA